MIPPKWTHRCYCFVIACNVVYMHMSSWKGNTASLFPCILHGWMVTACTGGTRIVHSHSSWGTIFWIFVRMPSEGTVPGELPDNRVAQELVHGVVACWNVCDRDHDFDRQKVCLITGSSLLKLDLYGSKVELEPRKHGTTIADVSL